MTKQEWKAQYRAERVAERREMFRDFRPMRRMVANLYARVTRETEAQRSAMRDADLFLLRGKSLASL